MEDGRRMHECMEKAETFLIFHLFSHSGIFLHPRQLLLMAHKILCREELCWYSQSSASVGPILPLMLLPQYQKRSQQVKWYNQIMNPQQKSACLFAIPQPVSTWVKHFCQILLEVTGKCFVCLTSSHEMHNETRHATGYCATAAWHHYCSEHNTGKKGLFFDCSGYSHTAEMGIKLHRS